MKLEFFQSYLLAISQDIGKKCYLQLFNKAYEELHHVSFPENESLKTFTVLNNRIYAGSTVKNLETSEETSSLVKLFAIENDKFVRINELKFTGPIISIKKQHENLIIAINNELVCFRPIENALELLSSVNVRSSICDIDIHNELIAVVTISYYLSIYSASDSKILLLYNFNRLDQPRKVKFLNENLLIVNDMMGNLVIFEISGTSLQPVSGFLLENQLAASIRKFTVCQESYGGERTGAVISTGYGSIYITISLSKDEFQILNILQEILIKHLESIDSYIESIHKPIRKGAFYQIPLMINGDVVEKFEELKHEEQFAISQKLSTALGKTLTDEFLKSLISSLSRMH
jgi:hypothetical protein